MLIQFTNCTVTYKNELLFSPEMGGFDMAVGKEIVSAFTGAADYNSFPITLKPSDTKTIQKTISEKERELNELYKSVRTIRESKSSHDSLTTIFESLRKNHPFDWLLSLEIYELTKEEVILQHLISLKETSAKIAHLIDNGIELINR
jgi:phenylalanine-4-hydroxylase